MLTAVRARLVVRRAVRVVVVRAVMVVRPGVWLWAAVGLLVRWGRRVLGAMVVRVLLVVLVVTVLTVLRLRSTVVWVAMVAMRIRVVVVGRLGRVVGLPLVVCMGRG